jgi:hypothetical protein
MKRTPSKLFFSALIASILCLFANSILYAASDEQSPTTPAAIDLEVIQMTAGFFDVSMRGDNQLLSNKLLDSLYTGYRIPNQKRAGVFFEITAMLGSFFTESLWRPSSILFNLLIRRGG